MKKVTLTFVVSDDVVEEIKNDLAWGDLADAASCLNAKCEESDYDICPVGDYSEHQQNEHQPGFLYKLTMVKKGCEPYLRLAMAKNKKEAVRKIESSLSTDSGWEVAKVEEA